MDRTRKIAQTDLRKNVRGLAEFAVTVLLGLCELKSGVRVLPLCVLIALGKPRFPVFAGAFLSSVLTANGLYLHTAVIMTVYGLEWLLDKKDICPAGRFKIMLACAASLIIAVGEATRGNLIFEDILRSALVFIFIPFSVAALEGVTNPAAGKMRRELGVVTAVFMAVKGAELLFYPTAIGSEPILSVDSMPHWRRCMQGHSASNLMPVIAANRVGLEEVTPCEANGNQKSALKFYGSSFITDGAGEVIRSMDRDSEGVITAEFDLDELERERFSWGLFRDRRPEMYHE